MNKMKGTAKNSERHEIKMPGINNGTKEVTYISFPSFEEFSRVVYIELLFKKIEKRSNDRDKLRRYLKIINEKLEDCERMEIFSNDERSFDQLFYYITDFLSKVEYDISHKYEKKLQIQIANKLWDKRTCSLAYSYI